MACITSLYAVACSSPQPAAPSPPKRPRIVAHRGASLEAPENTLAAFRRAWELGVECVELDVHVTRDGHAVVIHDASTGRTAGRDRPVREQTLEEIKQLDAGGWKDPAYAGERIPTLGEVLAAVPSGRTLFVEIKPGAEAVPAIAKAIHAADPRPRGAGLALQGFDPAALAAFAAAVPGAPAYWTVGPPLDKTDPDRPRPLPYPRSLVEDVRRHGFPGVALFYGSVDDELLGALRAAGILVDVWTINEPAEIERWYARDVRWIETDRPDRALAR
jgi:glycerophosphoryl diester phosphodiesterase